MSHYQTILDSYNIADSYIHSGILPFLANQELQENNQWLIDYAFEEIDRKIVFTTELWRKLTPEMQLKNKSNFKKIIDLALGNKNKSYYLIDFLHATTEKLLDENASDIMTIYDGNEIEKEKLFRYIFEKFSDNFKENY